MHKSFLEFLVSPYTGQPLSLESESVDGDVVIEGRLVAGDESFPIVRSVPRFVDHPDDNYAQTFGYQWNKWARMQFESENYGKPMEGWTRRTWEGVTSIEGTDLQAQVIGDFGCGPGRFIEIAREKGAKVIGLDISSAVEAAAENFRTDPDVLICQADALCPPIRPASLDGAFSIGVLHHTPDPARGFSMMCRAVRPGGWIACSVYARGGHYDAGIVIAYRKLFRALRPLLGCRPALAYAHFAAGIVRPLVHIPVFGRLIRRLFPVIDLPDRCWSLLDTFDSVTPTYQSGHGCYETYQWFKTNGLTDIEPSRVGEPTAWHAINPFPGAQQK